MTCTRCSIIEICEARWSQRVCLVAMHLIGAGDVSCCLNATLFNVQVNHFCFTLYSDNEHDDRDSRGGGRGGGGRGARGRDRRGGRWIRSRAGRGHRVVGANQRSQLQDEDGNLMMDDLERDTQGGKIR